MVVFISIFLKKLVELLNRLNISTPLKNFATCLAIKGQ